MSGLYIHIPFCRQKCRYCDFPSFAAQEEMIDAYLAALQQEAALYPNAQFNTLYIGGGTPSLLTEKQLSYLLDIITWRFGGLSSFEECTMEANPESLTAEKLNLLKDAGLSRLSLGLQSFNDAVLKKIGRIHQVSTFLKAYEQARKAGFENINVDLIGGLPGETEEDFIKGVEKLVALDPMHISVYGLQVEEGTPFAKDGISTDEDVLRRELEKVHEVLGHAGYQHYEISNYARPGHESKHNMNYWQNGSYLGLGSAAASYLNGERRYNVLDVKEYLRRMEFGLSPVESAESLTGKAKEGERIMLGLRMLGGIKLSEEQSQMFASEIEELCARGLVSRQGDLLKLTFEGMFLANQAFMAFVGPFDA